MAGGFPHPDPPLPVRPERSEAESKDALSKHELMPPLSRLFRVSYNNTRKGGAAAARAAEGSLMAGRKVPYHPATASLLRCADSVPAFLDRGDTHRACSRGRVSRNGTGTVPE